MVNKITINTGIKEDQKNEKRLEDIKDSLQLITGQKPITTNAKKSISSFGITEGETLGFKVTLRGNRRDDFFDKLYKIVLPRVKDFEGIDPKSFDQSGNLTIGFPDAKVFPELKEKHDLSDFGLEVIITTSIDNPKKAVEYLEKKGIPIKKD